MKKNFVKIGKKVIDLEIEALKKTKNSMGKSFNDAVEIISKCQSKVILCGVGKSGLIASKISATLSSLAQLINATPIINIKKIFFILLNSCFLVFVSVCLISLKAIR